MKIVNLDAYTIHLNDLNWNELAQLGDLVTYDRVAPEDVIPAIENADAVFTSKVKLTKEVIEACPNLKFIGVTATGYDNIDLDAAKARGIAVCNVPAYSTESVAQHTFALILEITNHVGHYTELVHEHQWENSLDFTFIDRPLTQLSGRSLGIIGYGSIGKRVARIAEAFGMTVHVYSKDPDAAVQSDILTLHCPATADNRGFINKDFISKMKDGAILINTARGALLNEDDVADALKRGKLAAVAVDVVNGEPPRKGHPFIGLENLYITPHIAWSTREARSVITKTSAANLKSFLAGGDLNRIV
ncbi:MAG: D-2-hydroxyacid dehydrogenase [Clostridia bacterium]